MVASKKRIANRIFGDHLLETFEDPFLLPLGERDMLNLANEYPENIKAIGSTGRTNLLPRITLGIMNQRPNRYFSQKQWIREEIVRYVPELFVT